MDIDLRAMGQRIRKARKMRQITVEQLAEQINISPQSLGHIECGARKTSLQTLINIADFLNVSLDYLIGRSESPTDRMIEDGLAEEKLTQEQMKMLLDMAKDLIPYIQRLT